MRLEPLTSFTWATHGVPLAALAVRVEALAAGLDLPLRMWDEPGLGPARGFGCRMPSGRACLLEELELAIRYQGARGPTVYVEAADLGALGVAPMVAEVLGALGLSRSDLAGVAGTDAQQGAAELVSRMSRRSGGAAEPDAAPDPAT
ncbi:hypothetical protein [Frigoriglobus tundricola]|uniref:Uncharacterized protein n=1 Tax=Frigoriglobus tundricola TaxID=2774151 RepID=A0A6M5YK99_9BACT|nr:hypothetical protein [Frigoriglobus tundricola]QJW93760.1 hypothetical protein FTUN_1271 [Frigoriglobus tundricola]